jgi:hypothetical protein
MLSSVAGYNNIDILYEDKCNRIILGMMLNELAYISGRLPAFFEEPIRERLGLKMSVIAPLLARPVPFLHDQFLNENNDQILELIRERNHQEKKQEVLIAAVEKKKPRRIRLRRRGMIKSRKRKWYKLCQIHLQKIRSWRDISLYKLWRNK